MFFYKYTFEIDLSNKVTFILCFSFPNLQNNLIIHLLRVILYNEIN